MSDEMREKILEAYNKGFQDGYEAGSCDYKLYEQDMEAMRNDN